MPYRKTILAPGEIYHIFNRGIAGQTIFNSDTHFRRFLELINYYRFANTPVSYSRLKEASIYDKQRIFENLRKGNQLHVEILAFCLMDNHFHFLLKQVTSRGIAKFISNLQNGYAKYFNLRIERTGPLFQPMFKSVRITTDEQLLHVSRYIHLNPSTGYLVEIDNLENYPWSSLADYLSDSEHQFITTSMILELINSREKYKEFVFDQAGYQRKLADIKHLTLE